MKKLLVLILFLLSFNFAFAQDNLKVPENLAKQYKSEIQKIIDVEAPKVIRTCFDYEKDAQRIYAYTLKAASNSQKLKEGIESLENIKEWIENTEITIYSALIDATDNYIKIKYKAPATSDAIMLAIFIYPYLKANNIDIEKIKQVANIETQKAEQIELMIKHLESLY